MNITIFTVNGKSFDTIKAADSEVRKSGKEVELLGDNQHEIVYLVDGEIMTVQRSSLEISPELYDIILSLEF
jgi:hypothetical protein